MERGLAQDEHMGQFPRAGRIRHQSASFTLNVVSLPNAQSHSLNKSIAKYTWRFTPRPTATMMAPSHILEIPRPKVGQETTPT
jgi:hypothetical protein